ncbi:endonuclease VII domain-containing protein [Mycolicibacterium sp.]|uniref:endonuclease VII domain-containing protein n=1 Tax=Mycolicibacterium sp. TaxID=2320850 RepID=UPI00356695DA
METRRCTDCGQDLPLSSFSKSGQYLRSYCKPCSNERSRQYGQANKARRNERLREWRRANPEAARRKDLRARLMRKYRLTPEDVEAMREAQDGRCLLCDSADRDLVVDHCHDTGRVRGLLCRSCNTIVGQVELVPLLVERIGEYLRHGATSEFAISSKTSA